MENMTSPGKIRVLDPETISRIAAGEVIERPASIVKELVENALDAGAGRIEVEITSRHGSITRIRVSDNGSGMDHEDADCAFTAHATSKIRTLSDLSRVRSLGFRGEALASIAAISRLTLTTRKKGEAIDGVKIVNEGGSIIEKGAAGCPDGTCVEVDEIFYNTPARKKFMRSLATEMAYITGILERVILSRPDVSFRVLHNRRVLIRSPGGSVHNAALHLFGTSVAGALIPVHHSGSCVQVEGVLSLPSLSRQNPYQIFISINQRPVQSRALAQSVRRGYGTLLPPDRFPCAILNICIEPDRVDVNVHPTKREVRLHNEAEVRDVIAGAVEGALKDRDLTFQAKIPDRYSAQARIVPGHGFAEYAPDEKAPPVIAEPSKAIFADTERRLHQTALGIPEPGESDPVLPELEFLGQLDSTYILTCPRGGEDLILIDQHAAHERILYEQVRDSCGREPECQELIVPVALHLSPRERAMLPSLLPILGEVGFSVEEFGKGTFSIRAIPVVLGKNLDREGVRDLLSTILSGDIPKGPSDRERVLKLIACRGAIKGGTPCTAEQCTTLIGQLRRTAHPFSCPHGRPTMVTFKKKDLDNLFLRT